VSRSRRASTAALLACLLLACAPAAVTQTPATPTRLLVKPRAGVTLEQLDAILERHGARRVGVIEQINVYLCEPRPGVEAGVLARSLQAEPGIEFVEFDQRVPPASDRRAQ